MWAYYSRLLLFWIFVILNFLYFKQISQSSRFALTNPYKIFQISNSVISSQFLIPYGKFLDFFQGFDQSWEKKLNNI